MTYQNDVRYQIEISNLAKSPKPRWYVQGNLGGLVKFGLDPQDAAMKAGDIDAADQTLDNYANVITVANGNEENIVVEEEEFNGQIITYIKYDKNNSGAKAEAIAKAGSVGMNIKTVSGLSSIKS